MNATETFARHALTVRYEDMPDAAVTAAKTFILDSIGVGVAGAAAPFADEIFGAVAEWGAAASDEGAHLFARDQKLPAPSAAFVNGFQIHCQEFDCVHEPAVVHPMATILAAVLAEADAKGGVSGRDFISAVIVAVDVAAGLGVASKAPIKFFRPANAGLFGATLGVARLRGLTQGQALDALGYALAFCSGTMQAHVEGKPALPVQIGNAARGAIMACDIAQAGVPGPNEVFDGPFGYMTLFEGEYDLAPVVESLGKIWRITQVSHKPFPTGRAAQGGVVAVQKLREKGVAPENLQSLTLSAPPLIQRLVGRPYKDRMAVNYARLCFAYSGAIALIDGGVGLDDFTEARLGDEKIAAVAAKIRVEDDGTENPAAFTPQTATAVLTDGRKAEVTIDRLYGSPADPLSHEAHLEKFRACMKFGLGADDADRSDELIRRVDALENEQDMKAIARLASGK